MDNIRKENRIEKLYERTVKEDPELFQKKASDTKEEMIVTSGQRSVATQVERVDDLGNYFDELFAYDQIT